MRRSLGGGVWKAFRSNFDRVCIGALQQSTYKPDAILQQGRNGLHHRLRGAVYVALAKSQSHRFPMQFKHSIEAKTWISDKTEARKGAIDHGS